MDSCCGQGPSQNCRCYTYADTAAEAVRSYVRRRVPHAQDAEDITQDTLLRIYRSVEDLRDASAFEAWMYRIARSAITDHYRRAPHEPLPTDPSDIELTPSPVDEEPTGEAQVASCLHTLLTHLPPEHRRALELTDLGELTQQQAADQLGLSTSGVKSRVQRGRRLLRAEIRRCCELTLDPSGTLIDATVRTDDSSC